MKLLIQRVSEAQVKVDNKTVGAIKQGLLVFFGVEKNDTRTQADYLINKLINLRVFEDKNEKMNLSVQDIHGEILLISQFTLTADMSRGNRPGFDNAEIPDKAKQMYLYFIQQIKATGIPIETGIFQADMKVSLINDGPATFWLSK